MGADKRSPGRAEGQKRAQQTSGRLDTSRCFQRHSSNFFPVTKFPVCLEFCILLASLAPDEPIWPPIVGPLPLTLILTHEAGSTRSTHLSCPGPRELGGQTSGDTIHHRLRSAGHFWGSFLPSRLLSVWRSPEGQIRCGVKSPGPS